MTHTEALKLAKECGATAYTNRHYPDAAAVTFSPLAWEKFCKQALAAPVQEPVAVPEKFIDALRFDTAMRDYEPAGGTQVSKVWWDGDKLMAKPIPLEDIYTTPPAVQRQWVGLTYEELDQAWRSLDYTVSWEQHRIDIARAIEAKLKEKNG